MLTLRESMAPSPARGSMGPHRPASLTVFALPIMLLLC
jgi:hypothetical protein